MAAKTFKEFTLAAIPILAADRNAKLVAKAIAEGKDPKSVKQYKGTHSVFSGFNQMAREIWGKGFDVVGETNKLRDAKLIVTLPVKGGCMMYLPADAPATAPKDFGDLISKIMG